MLEALCGNANVKKILIFLFVNGKCYGAQLQRHLKTALTPLQKALLRLEKGGIIISFYEGKTRLYQFNPAYPLLPELEQLIKKAYSLLSSVEKKNYYTAPADRHFSAGDSWAKVLYSFWKQLTTVKQVSFQAKTKSSRSGSVKGKGDVTVVKESDLVLIFNEKGEWQGEEGTVNFSNTFRWTIDRDAGVISLEHLRRGIEHPVFLLDFAPFNNHTLFSVEAHLCEEDTYIGQIVNKNGLMHLHWRVIGPKKNDEINYYYS